MSRKPRSAAPATPEVAPPPAPELPESPVEEGNEEANEEEAVSEAPEPEPEPPPVPQWSPEELLAVAHLGPAIIGREMYEAAQAYKRQHGQNALGPATRGE